MGYRFFFKRILIYSIFLYCLLFQISYAENKVVNLYITYKKINYTGKLVTAIAVNNQIPGPTLHFKEGDHVIINVYNHLNKGTTIHWHGILVPWQMDGVDGVAQHAIPPGCVYHYEFTLHQSGTYWYHAHSGLQEQQGLYGAIIIDPKKPPAYRYNKDYVIVLSDWSNTHPDQIFANLKKDGDYYSPRFPLQPSLMKFLHDYYQADLTEKKLLLNDYKMMQQMRMSIYDLSDIAYDAFLINGHSNICPWVDKIKLHDKVRLRFIGASSSTNFRVKIPGAKMQIVHIQGNDVKAYFADDFFITPGETVDVLINIENAQPYIIYAESADTRGAAYGALVTEPCQCINFKNVLPFPEPKPVTRGIMENKMPEMTSDHMNHKMSSHNMNMNMHMDMHMPTEPTIIGDCIDTSQTRHCRFMSPRTRSVAGSRAVQHLCKTPQYECGVTNVQVAGRLDKNTTGTKYQNLIAAVKTNDPNKPVDGVIRMELFGYMNHFIWMINGLPEYRAKPIQIEEGKRYRIIFTNTSMMHHPMHIHGHWFILRNGHGDYDPLLHTIDVPPGATVVADIDGDASGQWFFHCHHLYHMAAGMSRVFQYQSIIEVLNATKKPQNIVASTGFINRPIIRQDEVLPLNYDLITHPMGHHAGFYFANLFDVGEDPYHDVQEITFKGLYGPDYNKLELFTNDAEIDQGEIENADMDVFYWHLISQFWAIKGGANYFYRPGGPCWQPGVGIEGLMPYFIDTNIRTYFRNGTTKFDIELERDTQITNNFFIRTGIRGIAATKTIYSDEIGSGLNEMRYTVRPYYRLMPGLTLFTQYEYDRDYGVFKSIMHNKGEATREDTVTFGFTILL